jgi:hypothetical protein
VAHLEAALAEHDRRLARLEKDAAGAAKVLKDVEAELAAVGGAPMRQQRELVETVKQVSCSPFLWPPSDAAILCPFGGYTASSWMSSCHMRRCKEIPPCRAYWRIPALRASAGALCLVGTHMVGIVMMTAEKWLPGVRWFDLFI